MNKGLQLQGAELLEYLFSRCVRNPNGCLEWSGDRDKRGYGRITLSTTRHRGHRLIWTTANGEIPHNIGVLHRCDNPPCCDLGHLFMGTNRDNVLDRNSKNRQPDTSGENNGNAKLTE